MTDEQFMEFLNPFVQLAHCFRVGDKIVGDKFLYLCSSLLSRYYVLYENKALLEELLKAINEAYIREDFIGLADILEFDITEYLTIELKGKSFD